MADAILGLLAEKLVTFIQDEAHYISEFSGQWPKMNNDIQLIQSYLNDVDQVKKKEENETLKTTSRKLRELIYDAEDIIVDCEFMFIKQQRQQAFTCMMCFSPHFLIFRFQMGKKLRKINQDIENLIQGTKTSLPIALSLPNQDHVIGGRQLVRHPILIKEDEIMGLHNDSTKIMEWLFQARGPLTVIGIVGMGGE